MAFDKSKFMRAQFEPRTAQVQLAALKDFFGEAEPVWTVRGQTANELARSLVAAQKNQNLNAILAAIGKGKGQINEMQKALGLSDAVPEDIAKRLEQLVSASVDPVIDMPLAVKLAETYPIEFYILTNKIAELTGLGMDQKKPPTSGETLPSET